MRIKAKTRTTRSLVVSGLLATRCVFAIGAVAGAEALAQAIEAAPMTAAVTGQTADACPLPEWAAQAAAPLPAFSGVLTAADKARSPITIVILGPLATGGRRRGTEVLNYPARLQTLLGDAIPTRSVKVVSVGKPRGNVYEQRALIEKQVLPLKPTLVIWQVGRADARGAVPSNRFGQELLKGIETLKGNQKAARDTILMNMQFHPNSEALYRTDEYRNTIAWVGRVTETPVVDRFSLIEHWWNTDFVDLDSTDHDVQKHSADRIQSCIADRLARVILDGVAAAGARNPTN